jgi:hypothetical protein
MNTVPETFQSVSSYNDVAYYVVTRFYVGSEVLKAVVTKNTVFCNITRGKLRPTTGKTFEFVQRYSPPLSFSFFQRCRTVDYIKDKANPCDKPCRPIGL